MDLERNTFKIFLRELNVDGQVYKYLDVSQLNEEKYGRLPYSIRVMLESAVRNCDEVKVTSRDVKNLLNWPDLQKYDSNAAAAAATGDVGVEVPFVPSRVLLQDFTGVPPLIDLATMRNTINDLGGDPTKFNPYCPVDLVLDQSLQVDFSKKLIVNQPLSSTSNTQEAFKTQMCSSTSMPNTNVSSSSSSSPMNCRCLRPNTAAQSGSSNSHPNVSRMRSSTPINGPNMRFPNLNIQSQQVASSSAAFLNSPNASFMSEQSSVSTATASVNQPLVQIDVGYKECPFHFLKTECADALDKNQELEFERNRERFQFLKWSSRAMNNMSIIPPGNGCSHHISLERLTRACFVVSIRKPSSKTHACNSCSSSSSGTGGSSDEDNERQTQDKTTISSSTSTALFIYPDSLVGTDSHTTQANGCAVLGWTVGGLDAEAVMLGQAVRLNLPRVVGYRLVGTLNELCTSTDLVISITKNLRQIGVVNKFVEFFGPGVEQLSMGDRTTIANMCPEYGALVAYFPFDLKTAQYLIQTGRDEKTVKLMCEYLKSVGLFRQHSSTQDVDGQEDRVIYSEVHELDLATIQPCVSGPKRSLDKIPLGDLKSEFRRALTSPLGFSGFGLQASEETTRRRVTFEYDDGRTYTLEHGSVVVAAITSCTNASNPSAMLAAALLAKRALEHGLAVRPYIRTSISPGSGLVIEYLNKSAMIPCLEQLGFKIVGYGCTKCIENSTNLSESVIEAIEKNDLVAVGVLSGNRNFEGRMHASTRASYLASPPLVIAYALAGRVDIDFESEPIGMAGDKPVYLRDIWPRRAELHELEMAYILPQTFYKAIDRVHLGCKQWEDLEFPDNDLYPWSSSSTYIKRSPFLDEYNQDDDIQRSTHHTKTTTYMSSIESARALVYLGDAITTDHISPAGSIARQSAAARYLLECGLAPRDFNSYGARRGNHEVMTRGTFASLRLVNKMITTSSSLSSTKKGESTSSSSSSSPRTLYMPNGREMDVYDASELYRRDATPLIVLAGKEYGSGSPRDWAVKGPYLLGVKAIIAESFEKSHRSSLVAIGIVPLQFLDGQNAEKLKLTGREKYTIRIDRLVMPKQEDIEVETDSGIKFRVKARVDSSIEMAYFRSGGILKYAVRNFL